MALHGKESLLTTECWVKKQMCHLVSAVAWSRLRLPTAEASRLLYFLCPVGACHFILSVRVVILRYELLAFGPRQPGGWDPGSSHRSGELDDPFFILSSEPEAVDGCGLTATTPHWPCYFDPWHVRHQTAFWRLGACTPPVLRLPSQCCHSAVPVDSSIGAGRSGSSCPSALFLWSTASACHPT